VVGPEEWLAHPGTVGRPWPGAEIRILDDDGQDLPAGEAGTVYLKLDGQAFEYYKDQSKTLENRRAGFFTVGDIGLLDEEGYLYLRDRKSDLVISGGVNLYPAEIEAVLGSHPAVGDVAVFGIPDNDLGEKLHAVIEPVAGRTGDDALLAELKAHCEASLGKFKVPRSMEFTDALPRDPNGKLFKRKLRAPFWEGMERSI
jgi:long-chain acyl-CoA synthetase